jgi:predicted HAD superfamily hydrolase
LDPEALSEYIKNNLDKILKEIRQAFGVSDDSIFYRIKQLEIIYKKIILYKKIDKGYG